MTRNHGTGIVWSVWATIYAMGVVLIDERWWTVGGAMMFAVIAVTIPLWSRLLPESGKD